MNKVYICKHDYVFVEIHKCVYRTRMHVHTGQKQFTCLSTGNWKFFFRHVQENIFELFASLRVYASFYVFLYSLQCVHDQRGKITRRNAIPRN